jgi:hypothetical protein
VGIGVVLEIRDDLRKYCHISDDGSRIDYFCCPVSGCNYRTRLGPGALRMHMLLKADPKIEGRYCEAHDSFCQSHLNELSTEMVRYMNQFPRRELESN